MHRFRNNPLTLGVLSMIAAASSGVAARAIAQQDAAATNDAQPTQFLRVSDDSDVVSLEIAITDYQSPDGGPVVSLVGVAHISDASYYEQLQRELEGFDVVLYESVMPPGAGGAGGDTADERAQSTRAVLGFLAGQIEALQDRSGAYPESLDALQSHITTDDSRLGGWVGRARTDGWGNPVRYQLADTSDGYILLSTGADGSVGGDGEATDIVAHDDAKVQSIRDVILASEKAGDDNLQAQLAEALNLAFQLEAINYNRPDWICSDMSLDQVQRSLAEKGSNFEVLGATLDGASLPAKVVKILLSVMKLADAFLDNTIADTFKVVLIEVLGDPAITQASFAQLGAGFEEVIINERNQVAVDDLVETLAKAEQDDRIAIFYGAGHMPDLAERLSDQLGLEETSQRWLPAMAVDLDASAVTKRDIAMIRRMVKQSMQMQMR